MSTTRIHHLLAAQADARPDAPALSDHDGRDITYGELDQIAAQLYRSLAAVKDRERGLRAKLGAKNRAHAVALGYQRGFLLADPQAHVVDGHELAAALQRAGYRLTRTAGVP